MSGKKFILFFLGIFILGALPIVIMQPTGSASAGLSAGFTLPFEQPWIVFFVALMGLIVALVGKDALITLPICLLSMLVAGHMLGLNPLHYAAAPYILLGSTLLVAFVAGVMVRKAELFGLLIAVSIGFQLGWHTIRGVPDIASPLYFLIGIMLGTLLVLAVSISLGLTLVSDESKLGRYLRESARFQGMRTLFSDGAS
jgi:hydrogenase/urease accessory protein HupE